MDIEAARRLLEWYAAMGADEAVGEMPANAFLRQEPAPLPKLAEPEPHEPLERPPAAEPRPRGVRVAPTPAAPPVAIGDLEAKANSLAELQALVAAFEGCSLKRTAKSLCFSRGSETAEVMIIGEAPGRDEDLQGRPFVGKAGQLLDKMLAAIGLDESSVYITNTVYWRPPGNRTPTAEEIEACAPFLRHQISLLRPKLLLLLGAPAAKSMLQTADGIMRLRGKWHSYEAPHGPIPVMATLHPAYLLRTPTAKRQAWQDLLLVKAKLAGG